jgi:hypothetical protein
VISRPPTFLAFTKKYKHGLVALRQRAEIWNPRTYSYMFMAEPQELSMLEQTRAPPNLAATQASTILGRIYFVNGMSRVGSKVLAQSLTMAEQLVLLSSSASILSEQERAGARQSDNHCSGNFLSTIVKTDTYTFVRAVH